MDATAPGYGTVLMTGALLVVYGLDAALVVMAGEGVL
jgi:hypothetical protein